MTVNSQTDKNIDAFNNSSADYHCGGANPTILIVDDDDDSRLMLKTLLEMWKFRVTEAKNGVEAINSAESFCPSLIMVDIKMPRFDGFNVMHHLRQSAKTEHVPIIFLSGCAESVYRRRATAAGGNEYFIKPINFEQLQATLGKYCAA